MQVPLSADLENVIGLLDGELADQREREVFVSGLDDNATVTIRALARRPVEGRAARSTTSACARTLSPRRRESTRDARRATAAARVDLRTAAAAASGARRAAGARRAGRGRDRPRRPVRRSRSCLGARRRSARARRSRTAARSRRSSRSRSARTRSSTRPTARCSARSRPSATASRCRSRRSAPGWRRRRSRSRTGASTSTAASTTRGSPAPPGSDLHDGQGRRGRLDDHAAARPQPLHLARADADAEDQGGLPGDQARAALVEGQDPRRRG